MTAPSGGGGAAPGEAARVARFLLAGGVAALANFGSRFAFSLALPYPAAVVAAYGVGMVTAFVLMRRYVFAPGSRSLAQQVAAFVGVNLLAVAQTLAVSLLLARWALPPLGLGATTTEALAHAVGVAVPVVTSYLAHRAWTFR